MVTIPAQSAPLAEALRSADWSGVSMGNKVLIQAAIEQLAAQSAPVVPEVAATLFRALVDDFKSFAVIGDSPHDGGEFYRKEPLYLAAPQPAAPVAECTNEDSWNCKYCRKTETCAALKDERNFGAPPKAAPHDQGDEVRRLREALELARPYLINAQAAFGAGMHEEVSRRLKIIDAALSATPPEKP